MEKLLKSGYLCHPRQACSLRRVTVAEGKARGAQIIEVDTAGGLHVDLLPDSGLDIGQVRFRGVNMSWISKNGPDAPRCDLPFENEFLKYFPGGLLYTGDPTLLIAQLLGILVTLAFVIAGGLVIGTIVKKVYDGNLRVSREDEARGLDVASHGESAYPAYLGMD